MENLESYRVFYEVAKAKNITKASENLYISQPAVSQTIKKLEDELAVKLFIRNKKGVELTRFGEEVFQKVENAMLNFKAIDRMVDSERELTQGNLVIGSGSNVAREILLKPIKNFLNNFPNIQITQIEDVQSHMLEKLRKGEVDVVISQQIEESEDFSFNPILKHKYIFIKKKGEADKRFIKISKGSFANSLFSEFERKNKIENLPEIIVSGYRMAIELVKQGLGVTLVPEFIVSDDIENGELEVVFENYKLPTITFGYYVNPQLITPATEVFIKFLNE